MPGFAFLEPLMADAAKRAAGLATREAYGRAIVELAAVNPDIVVVDADLGKSTYSTYFAQAYPDRFFEMGIAEANMMSVAAGLAASGKIPVATTFAVFATGRAFDQIRIGIAQPHLNVKIVASHAGLTVGEDGKSAQALEDLALMTSLPGFTVVVPSDALETAQVLTAAIATKGPFYIRTSRPATPILTDPDVPFVLGRARTMRRGSDLTIIAIGVMVAPALEAAARLAEQGIEARVLNMATIKPLDRMAVVRAAYQTGAIVTAEEHLEHGGLGAAVSQVLTRHYPAPLRMVAVRDEFGQSGKPNELMKLYGLTADDIVRQAHLALRQKARFSERSGAVGGASRRRAKEERFATP